MGIKGYYYPRPPPLIPKFVPRISVDIWIEGGLGPTIGVIWLRVDSHQSTNEWHCFKRSPPFVIVCRSFQPIGGQDSQHSINQRPQFRSNLELVSGHDYLKSQICSYLNTVSTITTKVPTWRVEVVLPLANAWLNL